MGWTSGIPGLVLRMGMSVIAVQVGKTGWNLPARLRMSVRRPVRGTLRILMGVVGLGGFRCSPLSNELQGDSVGLVTFRVFEIEGVLC